MTLSAYRLSEPTDASSRSGVPRLTCMLPRKALYANTARLRAARGPGRTPQQGDELDDALLRHPLQGVTDPRLVGGCQQEASASLSDSGPEHLFEEPFQPGSPVVAATDLAQPHAPDTGTPAIARMTPDDAAIRGVSGVRSTRAGQLAGLGESW